jgi:hypothetical protein
MEPGSCTLRPTQWLTVCTICHLASHLGENFQISVFSEHALTIIQIVQEMLLAQDVVLVSGNRELSAGEASLRSVQLIAVCPMVPFYLCFHMFVV